MRTPGAPGPDPLDQDVVANVTFGEMTVENVRSLTINGGTLSLRDANFDFSTQPPRSAASQQQRTSAWTPSWREGERQMETSRSGASTANQGMNSGAVAVLLIVLLVAVLGFGIYQWGANNARVDSREYTDRRPRDEGRGFGGGGDQVKTQKPVPTKPTCPPGYDWIPDARKCRDMFEEPAFSKKAPCEPGSAQRVPDPARGPGYFKLQQCGFAPVPTKEARM